MLVYSEMSNSGEILKKLKNNFPNLIFDQPLLEQLDSIAAINFIIQAETTINKKIDLMRFDMKEVSIEKALIIVLEESHQ